MIHRTMLNHLEEDIFYQIESLNLIAAWHLKLRFTILFAKPRQLMVL